MASDQDDLTGVILVMGAKGSGKSFFIDKLLEAGKIVSTRCSGRHTTECRSIVARLNTEESVAIIDTPGFDDDNINGDTLLHEIARYMSLQYASNIPLRGIVFTYPIIDPSNSSIRRHFELFKKICGREAYSNITIVTTKWDLVPKRQLAEARSRHHDLWSRHWEEMYKLKTTITTFDASDPSIAETIIRDLHRKEPITLKIQRELNIENRGLGDTTVGYAYDRHLRSEIEKSQKRRRDLEHQRIYAAMAQDRRSEHKIEREAHDNHQVLQDCIRRSSAMSQKYKDLARNRIMEAELRYPYEDKLERFLKIASTAGLIAKTIVLLLTPGAKF